MSRLKPPVFLAVQALIMGLIPLAVSGYFLSKPDVSFLNIFDINGSLGAISVAAILAILNPVQNMQRRPFERFLWGLSLSHIFIFLICVSAAITLANRPGDIGPIIAYSICGYIFSLVIYLLSKVFLEITRPDDQTNSRSFLICSGTILSTLAYPPLFIFTLQADLGLPLFNPVALLRALEVRLTPDLFLFSVSTGSFLIFLGLYAWHNRGVSLPRSRVFLAHILLLIYAINANFYIIYALLTAANLAEFLQSCWSNAIGFIALYLGLYLLHRLNFKSIASLQRTRFMAKLGLALAVGALAFFSFATIVPASVMIFPVLGVVIIAGFLAYVNNLESQILNRTAQINLERKKSDALLANILPKYVINDLKEKGFSEPRSLENISVMFTDFVGFTKISQEISATKLISELNDIFSEFDRITENHASERIKTIGDAYMCVSGLEHSAQSPQRNLISIALRMIAFLENRNQQNELEWHLRLGIASGDSVAGIVGQTKYLFDLFGDAVNTAARMESYSEPQSINIDQKTYLALADAPDLLFIKRPITFVKGKGDMQMYFVTSARTADPAIVETA
ncbi:MAG: adenylate/guanylate cyclase domain-containing protein [Paracoccaceae bacterium]|nr:adenylate/guanylate cyclase domain-containing protein [Paracoccaceae bacterium]MBT4953260.1 adenylate/guanylate cyclase domain-containing protein [Paracoccaceae bacterium]MBT5853649.1 adenylate/guanylate cyclase domain-containing protein [Paracoccaceae bacterium]MBT7415365.1 adenylate/guanylate cyclase domain-containing protein [Paracoccaceae bacterium]MCH1466609.1 adenylate/guanylate cyclase domain-containing protein [Paracoccaceae bacterium]|tara:strand:- start:1144 stop:2850 length:1707 start_codon:yes stop_codon:yes gene_type:complete